MTKVYPVILSGGAGTRLWPKSRRLYPKQLQPMTGERTMLQETVQRAGDNSKFAAPIIVANEDHRFMVAEQLQEIGVAFEALILEPEGRNTAPAIALAAFHLASEAEDGCIMLVLPSDHLISDVDAFLRAADHAVLAARQGYLTSIGIAADRPHTGYGYLECGGELPGIKGALALNKFIEKPDAERAKQFLDAGNYLWNGGIFAFEVKRFLEELRRHCPLIYEACNIAMSEAESDLDFLRPGKEAFLKSPSDSVDYAIMEKAERLAVVPADMGWSDLGSWTAVWEVRDKDDQGNAITGDVTIKNTKNSLIEASGVSVAAVGLDNVIIVATKDAVLIASQDEAESVKEVVTALKASGATSPEHHTVVYRPWGTYETTDEGHRFQVKRIVVKPGHKLSLQKHHHRAEHWIVVQGTALVTRDDETFMVSENESTYIPLGAMHRLENPGKVPLHLIEVQSGAYLGEDDIVRIEDDFGRG